MPTFADVRTFVRYHLFRRAFSYPAKDPSLDVVPLPFDVDSFERTLREVAGGRPVEVLAELPYRERKHRVLGVDVGPATATARLLVLAGVHGNEHAGILAVPAAMARLDAEPRDVAVRFLAPVNPVGAVERSRFNANGYDINRDFVRFETPEARLVRDAIASFRPSFVVSLHEGPQDATFFFANDEVGAERSARLARALEAGGTTLAARDYFGRTLRPRGVAGPSAATRALTKAWASVLGMQATNGYASTRGLPEITLESSWRSSDADARVRAHVDLVLAVTDELAAPK